MPPGEPIPADARAAFEAHRDTTLDLLQRATAVAPDAAPLATLVR